MPIAPSLQRFVEDELARTPQLIERILSGTQQHLREARDSGFHPNERTQRHSLVETLQRQSSAYRQAFTTSLSDLVTDDLRQREHPQVAAGLTARAGLELMDESRVEVDIEISRAMQTIDSAAEWELRELQTFTSTLVGQTFVSAESNPFRPLAYATALWDAACIVTPQHVQRALLLRISAGIAASLLKKAWAAASTRLESQGVEASVYRTVRLAPGVSQRGLLEESSRPEALAQLLSSMPTGSSASAIDARTAVDRAQSDALPSRARVTPQFEQALTGLEQLLARLPERQTSEQSGAVALARRVAASRAALVASTEATLERQTIELLSRLFDTILADRQLHPAFVALVARLQVPALRAALRDRQLLESYAHPVWALLDRIGQAACAYPQANDPRALALLAFCQPIAEELPRGAAPDTSHYRQALERIDDFLAQQLQAQLEAARPTLEALEQAERRELIEQQISQRITEQMAAVDTTPGIRRFMTGTWSKVLAEAMLRLGEENEATRSYFRAVDDLLWSLQLPDHPQSRQRLLGLLPRLLECLRSGMSMIGLADAEQRSVLDELMTVHTEALRPGARATGALPTPAQIVERLREEVVAQAPERKAFADSVIDLGSMETVPAQLLAELQPDPNEAESRLETLRVADRQRLFIRGRWNRVQLLWRSDQRLYFLFAGEAPGRTHSITRRALQRLDAAGLLQPLETKPLVQRAADAVSRELAIVS